MIEFWFFDSSFLLLFTFGCIGHAFPHFGPQFVRPGGRLFSCQSPLDHENPTGGFSFNKANLVKPVHASDNSRCPSTFQKSSIFVSSIYIQGNVDVLHRNRKCFFSRHVQFDSGFHMMAINEISCNRPEIILASASSSLDVGLEMRVRLILFEEEFLVLLLGLGCPGSR